jgi:hypothetical protein
MEHLEKCVASVYKKLVDFPSWEIIIINNDENQSISELNIDFSRIKIIEHQKNIGFGSGINLGAKIAEGEFLLILNPDTEILSENIGSVIGEFEKNNEIGIIGGGIVDGKNSWQQWSAGKEISFFNLIKNNLGFHKSKSIWNNLKTTECDWVAGTAMFIRKKFFKEIGGFDGNFFMYFEDMDLCRRARKANKKIIYFPGFKVLHENGGSYMEEDQFRQKRNYYDSLLYYFKKNRPKIEYAIINIIKKFFFSKG